MRSLFLSGFCFICLVISSASSFSQEHSVDAVRDWTAAALTEAMTFNFANYEEHKKMNRRLFTDSGYKSFYKAMDNSQIPAYVTREKIMLSLELACTPELTEKREIPQKAWVFETPAMIVYNAGTRVKKDPVVITSVIEKSANEQNTQGLGIQQWVTRPVTEAEIGICKDQDRIETEILRLEQEKQELQKRINELKAEAAAAP